MIVPDANLLLYAYDQDSPFHDKARRWWQDCLSGTEAVGLTQPAVFAFIRVGTSPRAFEEPMTLSEARRHVDAWLARRIVQVLEADATHIRQVLDLLAAAGSAGGNLVTDAQIAALAIMHRASVHTADHDFRRFPSLNCHYPLD